MTPTKETPVTIQPTSVRIKSDTFNYVLRCEADVDGDPLADGEYEVEDQKTGDRMVVTRDAVLAILKGMDAVLSTADDKEIPF